jgi:hypothetical protein
MDRAEPRGGPLAYDGGTEGGVAAGGRVAHQPAVERSGITASAAEGYDPHLRGADDLPTGALPQRGLGEFRRMKAPRCRLLEGRSAGHLEREPQPSCTPWAAEANRSLQALRVAEVVRRDTSEPPALLRLRRTRIWTTR